MEKLHLPWLAAYFPGVLTHGLSPRPWLAALFFLVTMASAHAGLTWAQKKVELEADAGTEVLEAHFHFTNDGAVPVDIRQVESSCGCTTAELVQRHYEPGQTGEIVARYTVAGHMGTQTKTLAVLSSDRAAPTTLTLAIHIAEIARLQPAFVTWAHDEPRTPKTITLDMLQAVAPRDVNVESSSTEVSAELRTVVKDRKYQLVVTPAGTGQFVHAILTIHCRFGEKEQTFRSYATVQPPLSNPYQ